MWRDFAIILPSDEGKEKFDEVFCDAQEFWAQGNGGAPKIARQIAELIDCPARNILGFAREDDKYFILSDHCRKNDEIYPGQSPTVRITGLFSEPTQKDIETDAAGNGGCMKYGLGQYLEFTKDLPPKILEVCERIEGEIAEIWIYWGIFDHIEE